MVDYANGSNDFCENGAIPGEVCLPKVYRHFNQPMEQIPGFNSSKPQVLCHSAPSASCPYVGLFWASLECYDVVDCISLTSEALVATKKTIGVFKVFNSTAYCSVPLVECSGNPPPPTDTPTDTPTATPTPTPTPTAPLDDNPISPIIGDGEELCPEGFYCYNVNPDSGLCNCCPDTDGINPPWIICTNPGNPAYGLCVPYGYNCTTV